MPSVLETHHGGLKCECLCVCVCGGGERGEVGRRRGQPFDTRVQSAAPLIVSCTRRVCSVSVCVCVGGGGGGKEGGVGGEEGGATI